MNATFYECIKLDAFVKSQELPFSVIPAKAGIQEQQTLLDPGFRRGDGLGDFCETVKFYAHTRIQHTGQREFKSAQKRKRNCALINASYNSMIYFKQQEVKSGS